MADSNDIVIIAWRRLPPSLPVLCVKDCGRRGRRKRAGSPAPMSTPPADGHMARATPYLARECLASGAGAGASASASGSGSGSALADRSLRPSMRARDAWPSTSGARALRPLVRAAPLAAASASKLGAIDNGAGMRPPNIAGPTSAGCTLMSGAQASLWPRATETRRRSHELGARPTQPPVEAASRAVAHSRPQSRKQPANRFACVRPACAIRPHGRHSGSGSSARVRRPLASERPKQVPSRRLRHRARCV